MNMDKKILITILNKDDISLKNIINNNPLIKDYHELQNYIGEENFYKFCYFYGADEILLRKNENIIIDYETIKNQFFYLDLIIRKDIDDWKFNIGYHIDAIKEMHKSNRTSKKPFGLIIFPKIIIDFIKN